MMKLSTNSGLDFEYMDMLRHIFENVETEVFVFFYNGGGAPVMSWSYFSVNFINSLKWPSRVTRRVRLGKAAKELRVLLLR